MLERAHGIFVGAHGIFVGLARKIFLQKVALLGAGPAVCFSCQQQTGANEMRTNNYHEFISALRTGRYTSVGSYPVSGVFSDGEMCCYNCMRKEALRIGRSIRGNEKDGWQIVAVDVKWENDEGQPEYCEQCGDEIEVAYS